MSRDSDESDVRRIRSRETQRRGKLALETPSQTTRSLRLARVVVELAAHGDEGLTAKELSAIPAIRSLYGESDTALYTAVRRDLISLTGKSLRALKRSGMESATDVAWDAQECDGVPLVYRHPATGRYVAALGLHALRLSRETLDALCLLAGSLRGGEVIPDGTQLFAQIARALPDEQRVELEAVLREMPVGRLLVPIDFGLGKLATDDLDTLQRLLEVTRKRQKVTFAYRPLRNEPGEAKEHDGDEVEEVRFDSSHVYITVWCQEAQRHLELRLDRFAASSVRAHHDTLERRYKRRGVRIAYWLSGDVARYGVTQRLHGQVEEKQPDGSYIVRGEARNLFWARQLLLKYGENAKALEPPPLVEAMRKAAEDMARLYAPPAKEATGREDDNPQSG